MSTIERYIFKRLIVASLGAFAAMLAVVWVTQAVTRIDFATGTAQSALVFLQIMAYLTPQFFALTLPFGILIGTVNVFNALNSDSELPVVASAGVHRLTLMRPVVFISLIAGAAIFYSNHFVEPPTQRAVRDLIIEGRSDLLTSLISEGQFARPEKNLVFYVDGKSSDGALTGLMISDTRDPAAQLTYYAKNAVIGEINGQEALAMSSGQIHRRDTETGDISVIQFDSYALGLGQLGSAASTATYFLHERDTSDLLNPDPEDRFVQKWPGQPFAEVMKRSSEWLFPLLFGMIALVIAGQPQSHRKSNGVTMFYAFGAAMIYRWATYYLYNEAKNAPDLAYLLAAIPLIGVCLGVWMFLRGIEFKPEGVISVQWDRLARLFPKKRPAAG